MDFSKSASEWLSEQYEHETALLVGGPKDGQELEVSVNANGPFRLDVLGKGIALYQRISRRPDGQARARFIGYEGEAVECPKCGSPSETDNFGSPLLCDDCTRAKTEVADRRLKHRSGPPA